MVSLEGLLRRRWRQSLGQSLHHGPTAGLHVGGAVFEPIEEVRQLLLHPGFAAQAGVDDDLSRAQAQIASSGLKSGL